MLILQIRGLLFKTVSDPNFLTPVFRLEFDSVAITSQFPCPVVSAAAGFHADQARGHLGTLELLAYNICHTGQLHESEK